MEQRQQLIPPSEADRLVAAIRVRRDVQTLSQRDDAPVLREAIDTLRTTWLGEDPETYYRRLLDVVVAAEEVAVRLRVANPDLPKQTGRPAA